MHRSRFARSASLVALIALLATMLAGSSAAVAQSVGRYLVVARTNADYQALKAQMTSRGAKVVMAIPEVRTLVVNTTATGRASIAADSRTLGIAPDRIIQVAPPESGGARLHAPGLRSARHVRLGAAAQAAITPDPAWDINGLLWDFRREGLPKGWNKSTGLPRITVAVADTGLDFTHSELASKIDGIVDLTTTEDPPICKHFFGASDQDLADQYGGPATTDWNGHGSWIGGNIAAALDGQGINGIVPDVRLVGLKISQWCGSAYDSELLDAFVIAANNGIDVVNISFGGYLDRSDPAQDLIYQDYVDVVRYARSNGTVIVASAGNEATRIAAGGQVVSHGTLTAPGAGVADYYGQYQVPGGIPGVVDVSSTGNVVAPSSASCSAHAAGSPTNTFATCKPLSDPHQAAGSGLQDQLAYYSNYGPRIDIAGQGGARKFNLPVWDRGGTPGFPYTGPGRAWEDFSTTSNWATQIPCFTISGGGFPADQCYTSIQGTSMAAPHVAAAVAMIASAHHNLRHDPAGLIARLKSLAVAGTNWTQELSATDTSPSDLTGIACATGYCHLGGSTIPSGEAYGAGLARIKTP
jgi:lantibiotic leader peptide-processing serine protease